MPDSSEAKAVIEQYCNLMEEIKHRHHVINIVGSGQLDHILPPAALYEFCYLQLRMICELIALGSLVAHGDIKSTRSTKISKRYEADWIIKTMSRLHPTFYPRPSRHIHDAAGNVTNVEFITSGFLTKRELADLYHKCGRILHRGTLASLSEMKAKKLDFKEIGQWLEKIVTLLNHHQIALFDGIHEYWVMMEAAEDGIAHGFLMKKITPKK